MILGQTYVYSRRKGTFSWADRWGAGVAHHEIVRAALEHDVVDAFHMFLDGRGGDVPPSVLELQAEFGRARVEVKSAAALAAACEAAPYVFPTAFGELEGLFEARAARPHDAFPICVQLHTVPAPQLQLRCYLELLLLARAHDALVVSSRAGRRAVMAIFDEASEYAAGAFGHVLRPEFEVVDIPLAVDDEFLGPRDRARSRELLGLAPDGLFLLYMGRLTEAYKADLEPLATMFVRLARERPDVHLVLAGQQGPERYGAQVHALASAAGVGDRVRVVANFPHYLKPFVYSACDLFVSPVDNVQETFGLAVIEAMSSGLAVVASDWSGYRDLVVDGETGFLIPTYWCPIAAARAARMPAVVVESVEHRLAQHTAVDVQAMESAVRRLVASPQLRQRMGEAGRRRVLERFSWRRVVRAYGALWDEQRARLMRDGGGVRFRIDPNRCFEQIASAILEPATLVRCSAAGRAVLEREEAPLGRTGMSAVSAPGARELLSACRTALPLSVATADGRAEEVAALLLKQGYLEVVRPSPLTDARAIGRAVPLDAA